MIAFGIGVVRGHYGSVGVAPHLAPPPPTTGDRSKCRDDGNDCCANEAGGEPATCADGYTPSTQPQSYDDCPNYTCYPPGTDGGGGGNRRGGEVEIAQPPLERLSPEDRVDVEEQRRALVSSEHKPCQNTTQYTPKTQTKHSKNTKAQRCV